MAYSVELEDGGKIVLLYAKNFVWKDERQAAMLDNQPISGRVYRAFKAPNSDVWYLKLVINPAGKSRPIMDGVRITSLNYSAPEWDCEFVEIDDYNMLDLDISSEDYRQITEWSENNHKDFVELIYGESGFDIMASKEDDMEDIEDADDIDGKEISEDIKNKILGLFERSIVPYTSTVENNIKYLSLRDPLFVKALTTLTNFIVETSKREDTGKVIPLAYEISLSKDYGKGANIYSTMYNLDKYINQDGTEVEILSAIQALLFELIRLDMQKAINPR